MKHFLCVGIFFLLTACGGSASKGPVIKDPGGGQDNSNGQWKEHYYLGSTMSSEVTDILITEETSIYVSGYIKGNLGQTNIEPSGNAAGVVYKLQAKSVLNEATPIFVLDTHGTDVIESLAFNQRDKRIYFSGRTTGAIEGNVNQGQFDLLFGIVTESFEQMIAYQFGSPSPQRTVSLVFTRNDDAVIIGYDDIYVPSNYVEAWSDPYILSLTPTSDGYQRSWGIKYATAADDVILDAAVDVQGTDNITVVGSVFGGEDKGAFVASYQSDATSLWRKRQTTHATDSLAAIKIKANGNILIAGTSSTQVGDQVLGGQDIFLREIDAQTGDTLWTHQYGTEYSDQLVDMALDAQEYIYLTGNVFIPGATSETESQEIILLKLNADGSQISTKRWQSPTGHANATSLAVNNQETVFIGGYTEDVANKRRHGIVLTFDSNKL